MENPQSKKRLNNYENQMNKKILQIQQKLDNEFNKSYNLKIPLQSMKKILQIKQNPENFSSISKQQQDITDQIFLEQTKKSYSISLTNFKKIIELDQSEVKRQILKNQYQKLAQKSDPFFIENIQTSANQKLYLTIYQVMQNDRLNFQENQNYSKNFQNRVAALSKRKHQNQIPLVSLQGVLPSDYSSDLTDYNFFESFSNEIFQNSDSQKQFIPKLHHILKVMPPKQSFNKNAIEILSFFSENFYDVREKLRIKNSKIAKENFNAEIFRVLSRNYLALHYQIINQLSTMQDNSFQQNCKNHLKKKYPQIINTGPYGVLYVLIRAGLYGYLQDYCNFKNIDTALSKELISQFVDLDYSMTIKSKNRQIKINNPQNDFFLNQIKYILIKQEDIYESFIQEYEDYLWFSFVNMDNDSDLSQLTNLQSEIVERQINNQNSIDENELHLICNNFERYFHNLLRNNKITEAMIGFLILNQSQFQDLSKNFQIQFIQEFTKSFITDKNFQGFYQIFKQNSYKFIAELSEPLKLWNSFFSVTENKQSAQLQKNQQQQQNTFAYMRIQCLNQISSSFRDNFGDNILQDNKEIQTFIRDNKEIITFIRYYFVNINNILNKNSNQPHFCNYFNLKTQIISLLRELVISQSFALSSLLNNELLDLSYVSQYIIVEFNKQQQELKQIIRLYIQMINILLYNIKQNQVQSSMQTQSRQDQIRLLTNIYSIAQQIDQYAIPIISFLQGEQEHYFNIKNILQTIENFQK